MNNLSKDYFNYEPLKNSKNSKTSKNSKLSSPVEISKEEWSYKFNGLIPVIKKLDFRRIENKENVPIPNILKKGKK